MMGCTKLKDARDKLIKPLLESNPDTKHMSSLNKLKWLVSREMLEQVAPYIEGLLRARQDKVYKKT